MQVDYTILIAAQRAASGKCHNAANLAQHYVDACYADDMDNTLESRQAADDAKHNLYGLLAKSSAA
jgi:hypothetical protein